MKIECLDHGYVELVSHHGDDSSIVNSARVSYSGGGTKTVREDEGLIDYLWRNQHTSPFEIVNFTFQMKLPIFVARQIIRHRTARLNEMSARYSILPEEFYIPTVERMNPQSATNKQGSSEANIIDEAEYWRDEMRSQCEQDFELYQRLINAGLSRELARIVLPLNTYTEWVWQMDAKNLLHFLRLRLDSHAQYEVRVYAQAMYELIKPIIPMTIKAFDKHTLNGVALSEAEKTLLRDLMWQNSDFIEDCDMPERAKNELLKKMGAD